MAIQIGMVADDLTGALDAAAPFAARGMRTLVFLSPEASVLPEATREAEVICINTASREVPEDEASRRASAATHALMAHAPRLVFKKVDSRLKGHVAAETAAVLRASGRDQAVVAPAIPDLGRFVRNGAVVGMGVDQPIPVAARCGSLHITVPDTTDAADMRGVADELLVTADRRLAVGARGVALALAEALAGRASRSLPRPLPRPSLIAIGSRDPITRAQIEHAVRATSAHRIEAPNGVIPAVGQMSDLTLVSVEPGPAAEPPEQVAGRFADGLAAIVRESPPASLLVSGGETAYALLRRLGVEVLELGGEALGGVPFAFATVEGKSLLLLTKSGGFGAPETISSLFAPSVGVTSGGESPDRQPRAFHHVHR